jgi:hypothetical protein
MDRDPPMVTLFRREVGSMARDIATLKIAELKTDDNAIPEVTIGAIVIVLLDR